MSQINLPSQGRTQGQLRRTLRMLVTAVATLMIISAALFLDHLRGQTLKEAEVRAEAAARLLEEHVLRTFRSTEFIIDRVVRLAAAQSLDRLKSSREAWRALDELEAGLPEKGTLWISDAEGAIVSGSLVFPAMPSNVADRHYFQAHKRARRDLVIGPLVNVKTRDGQAFHLSKRIEDARGSLVGVAIAGIEAPHFTDFHHSLALGPKSNVAIFDAEGRLILHQPAPEQWVGKSVMASLVIRAAEQNPVGIIHARSALDGIERVVAYRVIEPFGVVVTCGVSIDEIMGGWWRAVAFTTAAVVALAAILGALAYLAFRSLAREEAMVHGLEAMVRDRTEEANLKAAEARRANESKTKFLATASHDLRQPLQAAGMFVEALSARLQDSPHLVVVDKLRQSVEATQALLSTLLDVSTLEAGHCQPSVTAFPLAPTLASLVDQMEPEATQRGLRLKVVSTDAWIVSDPVLLERMLRNLLVNALRYTERGGVLIGCRRRRGETVIQVVDTGIGIPADKRSAIFDDFTRLSEKGSGAGRGLGLGLSVVRRMAQLLGHEIELRSVPGKGSVFGVVVPLAPRIREDAAQENAFSA